MDCDDNLNKKDDHVETLCEEMKMPSDLHTLSFDVIDSIEEAFDETEVYGQCKTDLTKTCLNDNEFRSEEIVDSINETANDYEECFVAVRPDNTAQNSALPEGWKEVYHESGALLYWHPESNVCSLSRPYFIGTGSTKSHTLVESAIPCFSYLKSAGKLERSPTDCDVAASCELEETYDPDKEIVSYCKRLFTFKTVNYLKFKSWDTRRSYLRTLRNERNRRRYPYSDNKYISLPMVTKDQEGNVVSTNKWIMNPRGKSYVAILHEYLQQSLKTQPVYVFSEVDNARTPYSATVTVNGSEYGTGLGMSKKDAKIEAAKETLLVLLPKLKKVFLKDENEDACDSEENVASIFDDIEVTDPRVSLLSKLTTEPTPYELLTKCLRKKLQCENPDIAIEFKSESQQCKMSAAENSVTVKGTNKRELKQQAAQALLQALHPYINNWGSLLRLYGSHAADPIVEKQDEKVSETKFRPIDQTLLKCLRDRMTALEAAERQQN